MHFKLDENADPRWRLPLEHAGHFVSTISEEGLSGSDDDIIAKVSLQKRFALTKHFASNPALATEPTAWNYSSSGKGQVIAPSLSAKWFNNGACERIRGLPSRRTGRKLWVGLHRILSWLPRPRLGFPFRSLPSRTAN